LVFIVVILGESTGQMVSERAAVGVAPTQTKGESMEYLTGWAVVACAFTALVGFDRDRVFYPTLVTRRVNPLIR
jgi:hypothetical protein